MEVQILCANEKDLRETELRDEEEALDDFLTKHEADLNNSQHMQTEEFPLNLQHSNYEVLDQLHGAYRKELIRRIEDRFDMKPGVVVELATWETSEVMAENAYLTYDIDKGFMYDGLKRKLRDFCTDDLLFILGELL
jgi:hypothetical protein